MEISFAVNIFSSYIDLSSIYDGDEIGNMSSRDVLTALYSTRTLSPFQGQTFIQSQFHFSPIRELQPVKLKQRFQWFVSRHYSDWSGKRKSIVLWRISSGRSSAGAMHLHKNRICVKCFSYSSRRAFREGKDQLKEPVTLICSCRQWRVELTL